MAMVLVVRHGQASFGSDDYDVLSETGWEQGRRLGAHLAAEGLAPAAVVRGGMRRHRETVEAVLGSMAQAGAAVPDDVDVDDRWDEFDHLGVVAAHPDLPQGGTAELSRREFQEVFVTSTRRWARDARPAAEQADYPETFDAFAERSLAALAAACERAGDGPVLVVSSGGPVGVVAADLVHPDAGRDARALLWERFNTVCVNSAVSRVVIGAGGTRLLTFNEHPHLERSLVTYR